MNSFSTEQIPSEIQLVLEQKGIATPTEIQSKSIPVLLGHEGDFVGQSATGTGKTFAYGIPLLANIDLESGTVQAVVLVPTRELCEQVGNELIELSEHLGVKVEAIYGGTSLKAQIHDLSNGTQIVVATPGRLMDLVNRKVVDLSMLKTVVFDEADEMLLKGFGTDVDAILASSNKQYKTWLFSATMPDDIHILVKKYLKNSLKKVRIGKLNLTMNKGIDHHFVEVVAEEKLTVLLHYLNKFHDQRGIIFCRTKSGVQKLYKQLSANKFSSGALHGDLPQGLRTKVMDQFREGNINTLIATDVAARGIDVEEIGYVLQYHLPDTKDIYTHRSGRTARVGNAGYSLTFVFPEELDKLSDLEDELDLVFKREKKPNQKDQLVNQAVLWARKVAQSKPVGDKLTPSEKEEFKKQLDHLSKDELFDKLMATYLREKQ